MVKTGVLMDKLKEANVGQYLRIYKSLVETVNAPFDWRKVSVDELETLHGVGPKTSRFFVTFSRHTNKYAVLDTHMLKYLKSKGYKVPKTTPNNRRYKELEQAFIAEAKKAGKPVAEFDLDLWKKYSSNKKSKG